MRVVSPEEAVSTIGNGDQVYIHCAAAAPSALLEALVARAVAQDLTEIASRTCISRGPVPIWRRR
jgi:acyl-CoA hydrolase